MLLVVFGAGASYDSFPDLTPAQAGRLGQRGGTIWPGFKEWRPPLTQELFSTGLLNELRKTRPQIVQDFPPYVKIQPLIPELAHLPDGVTLEMQLETLRREAQDNPDLAAQLAALRFYLHALFCETTRKWLEVTTGTTNYVTLLNKLHRLLRGQTIILVTFNYDTLVEDALGRLDFHLPDVAAYVNREPFKVFKLHGSTNWARLVRVPEDLRPLNSGQRLEALFRGSGGIRFEEEFRLVNVDCLGWPVVTEPNSAEIPALAVPYIHKDAFECPPNHVTLLRELMTQVTKVLVVGWRGMETHFQEILAAVPESAEGRVVSSGRNGAQRVIKDLRAAGIRANLTPTDGGFTELVLGSELPAFLKG